MAIIVPEIGSRVVYYNPDLQDMPDQPLAAIVTWVWNDRCVNLAVFGQSGNPIKDPPQQVMLLQNYDVVPENGKYAAWPAHGGSQKP